MIERYFGRTLENFFVHRAGKSGIRSLLCRGRKPIGIGAFKEGSPSPNRDKLITCTITSSPTITPLVALQSEIERINSSAKDRAAFKEELSRKLFSKHNLAKEELSSIWEDSIERRVVVEIFSMIDLATDLGRPITFRDAFNRVYKSKLPTERLPLDRIAKALIVGR